MYLCKIFGDVFILSVMAQEYAHPAKLAGMLRRQALLSWHKKNKKVAFRTLLEEYG